MKQQINYGYKLGSFVTATAYNVASSAALALNYIPSSLRSLLQNMYVTGDALYKQDYKTAALNFVRTLSNPINALINVIADPFRFQGVLIGYLFSNKEHDLYGFSYNKDLPASRPFSYSEIAYNRNLAHNDFPAGLVTSRILGNAREDVINYFTDLISSQRSNASVNRGR